jgi:Antirestriction protein (ArdA)
MTELFAQPYDISATGFYFKSAEDYAAKVSALRNQYGQPVEEFEIQFIDGDTIDSELFEALSINQCNFDAFFDAVNDWNEHDKVRVILAANSGAYNFTLGSDDPDRIDIDIYECDTMHELAIQFVDDGLFGTVPKSLEFYINYDAIARDLEMDYDTATVDGTRYIFRCG